jgi:hypothetical protein
MIKPHPLSKNEKHGASVLQLHLFKRSEKIFATVAIQPRFALDSSMDGDIS